MSTDGARAELGVLGGSGLYELLDDVVEMAMDTPWGMPSAPIKVGRHEGRNVAFLPRHGERHEYPPHRINFRANLWAMHAVGVRQIVAPCASGSLRRHIEPGHFVVPDQMIDQTAGRAGTFYDGPVTHHLSFADPYCANLGEASAAACESEGLTVHRGGTVVVIQGPRFATRAESRWYRAAGGDIINMTQSPEAALARELGICYSALALITDFDAGVEDSNPTAVTEEEVFRLFAANIDRVRAVLLRIIAEPPPPCPVTSPAPPIHET